MAIKFHQRLHIPVVLGVGAVGRRAAGLDWILRIQIGGGRRLSIYPVQLIWKRRIKRKRVNGTVHREREREGGRVGSRFTRVSPGNWMAELLPEPPEIDRRSIPPGWIVTSLPLFFDTGKHFLHPCAALLWRIPPGPPTLQVGATFSFGDDREGQPVRALRQVHRRKYRRQPGKTWHRKKKPRERAGKRDAT